ncbi:hypothetical protein QJQ45_022567, partial [Haematococcus lacustris]
TASQPAQPTRSTPGGDPGLWSPVLTDPDCSRHHAAAGGGRLAGGLDHLLIHPAPGLLGGPCPLLLPGLQRGQHRSLLGGILPPGVGPATTLMVTDIQDSTALWEALPDHVMDATIALHHATIRACLTAFTAYEVTTEGDSFILATHNPHDALLLATAIHQQLLQCSWPGELLNMPQCSPIWAVPSTSTALVAQSNAALRYSASGPTLLEASIGSRSRSIDPWSSKHVPSRLRSYRHRRSSHSPASRSPHMTASALWAVNNASGQLMGPRSTTALDDPQFSTKAMSELDTAAQRNGEVLPWLQRPQLS